MATWSTQLAALTAAAAAVTGQAQAQTPDPVAAPAAEAPRNNDPAVMTRPGQPALPGQPVLVYGRDGSALTTFHSSGADYFRFRAPSMRDIRSVDFICPQTPGYARSVEVGLVTRYRDVVNGTVYPSGFVAARIQREPGLLESRRYKILNASFSGTVAPDGRVELQSAPIYATPEELESLKDALRLMAREGFSNTCNIDPTQRTKLEKHTIFYPYGTSVTQTIAPKTGALANMVVRPSRNNTATVHTEITLYDPNPDYQDRLRAHVYTAGLSNHVNRVTRNGYPVLDAELRNYDFLPGLAQIAIAAHYSGDGPNRPGDFIRIPYEDRREQRRAKPDAARVADVAPPPQVEAAGAITATPLVPPQAPRRDPNTIPAIKPPPLVIQGPR
ncbi:MAG: hypothetical protein WAO98_05975 [Alphaproteobacteria bacterium]